MTAKDSRVVPLLRPWLLAAATASLLGLAAPARAQFYDYSGVVGTSPFDFFPIDRAVSFYDMTGNGMFVGYSEPGSFSMHAGAWLKVDWVNIGNAETGSGSVDVSGASTRLELGGTGIRLNIGNWGTGSLTVSAGALVDAALPAGACAGGPAPGCFSVIGNAAGSTGTLTVTGSGSEVRALRYFGVGQAHVESSGYGTPGGTTNATVDVLDGGTLRTEQAFVGNGPSGSGALGTERVVANVTIDGPGSQWIVTRNSVDNGTAFFGAGNHANAEATINVTNGGKLIVDGTGSIGPFDGMNLGNNGHADLTVSGVGSAVQVVNATNPYINVGRSGATGQASFSVLAGATASAMFLNVGRDLAYGDLLIDGAGSQLTLSGVGTSSSDSGAGASIGRDGGTGTATVRNGGRWLITDGGADSRPNASIPGFSVGRGAAGIGSLLITGADSTVEVVSTTLGLAPGVPDNYNPGVTIGYLAGSTGTLLVENGGKLLLTGNAVSTVADPRTTFLGIGGSSDVDAGGYGNLYVSGLGSEVRVSGSDAFISVGRAGSVGLLSIADKGLVAATNMNVGRVGLGYLGMDNGTLEMSGQQTGNVLAGASLVIGNRGGTGVASLANGSRVTITNLGTSGAGLYLGGTTVSPLGSGSLSMTGGSRIDVVAASGLATMSVGHDGSGIVAMDQGSAIDVGNGSVYLGRTATGVGIVTLGGASTLNAGYVGIGSTPGVDTGIGTLIVNDGSTVTATTVEIGARGLLGGNGGTINADVIIGGTLDPGESPGKIRINGGVIVRGSGTLVLDVLATVDGFAAVARGFINPLGVLTPGYEIDQVVLGSGSDFDFAGLTIVMNFLGTTDPTAFAESGGLDLDNFMRSADGDIETGLSTVFAPDEKWTDVLADANIVGRSKVEEYDGIELAFTGSSAGLTVVVSNVPEPSSWLLMLAGLWLLAALAWRRRQQTARPTWPARG